MTKMVQFSDEAYRRLKEEKRPGESFSDVVLRRFPAGSMRELAGILTKEEGERARRIIADIDTYSLAKEDDQMRRRSLL